MLQKKRTFRSLGLTSINKAIANGARLTQTSPPLQIQNQSTYMVGTYEYDARDVKGLDRQYTSTAEDMCTDIKQSIERLELVRGFPHMYLGIEGYSVAFVQTDEAHAQPNETLLCSDIEKMKSWYNAVANGNIKIPYRYSVVSNSGVMSSVVVSDTLTQCPDCEDNVPSADVAYHKYFYRHQAAVERKNLEQSGYIQVSEWSDIRMHELSDLEIVKVAIAAGMDPSVVIRSIGESHYAKQELADIVDAYVTTYKQHMSVGEYCDIIKSTPSVQE